MTALLRNGQKAEAVDLYGRISKAQVKAGRGAECFSSQAFESAVGYWAKAIEEELAERDLEIAERDRLSELATASLLQSNYDPNLNPRVSEAAPIEATEAGKHNVPQPTVPAAAAVEHTEEQTEASASAVARAVRFTAIEARAEAGGATSQISEAGGATPPNPNLTLTRARARARARTLTRYLTRCHPSEEAELEASLDVGGLQGTAARVRQVDLEVWPAAAYPNPNPNPNPNLTPNPNTNYNQVWAAAARGGRPQPRALQRGRRAEGGQEPFGRQPEILERRKASLVDAGIALQQAAGNCAVCVARFAEDESQLGESHRQSEFVDHQRPLQ